MCLIISPSNTKHSCQTFILVQFSEHFLKEIKVNSAEFSGEPSEPYCLITTVHSELRHLNRSINEATECLTKQHIVKTTCVCRWLPRKQNVLALSQRRNSSETQYSPLSRSRCTKRGLRHKNKSAVSHTRLCSVNSTSVL